MLPAPVGVDHSTAPVDAFSATSAPLVVTVEDVPTYRVPVADTAAGVVTTEEARGVLHLATPAVPLSVIAYTVPCCCPKYNVPACPVHTEADSKRGETVLALGDETGRHQRPGDTES